VSCFHMEGKLSLASLSLTRMRNGEPQAATLGHEVAEALGPLGSPRPSHHSPRWTGGWSAAGSTQCPPSCPR
jgi:hypothetical protein